MRVVGVHVASGAMNMLFADCTAGVATYAESKRIGPSASLNEAALFADLVERTTAELRAQQVDEVALLETRQYTGLKYKPTYGRVIAIAALMAAANNVQVPFETHKTGDVGKKLDLPAKSLETIDLAAIGLDKAPTYWTTGMAEAAAVAACRA